MPEDIQVCLGLGYIGVCGCSRIYVNVHECLLKSWIVCGSLAMSRGEMSMEVPGCIDKCAEVQEIPEMSRHVQGCPRMSKDCPGMSRDVQGSQGFSGISRDVQGSQGMSRDLKGCPGMSRDV